MINKIGILSQAYVFWGKVHVSYTYLNQCVDPHSVQGLQSFLTDHILLFIQIKLALKQNLLG